MRSSAYDAPLAAASGLKAALRSGETRVGAFSKVPSPDLVELLAGAGMEFVVADAEHGPIGPETCQHMVRAADAAGVPLLVRVAETDSPAQVCRYLDTGVAGIHLPQIKSAADARERISWLFHPPTGRRGVSGGRWARYGARGQLPTLVSELPTSLVVVVQIEDVRAIDALDALLEVNEIDAFFLGPTDLAASMGRQGDKSDPAVVHLVGDAIGRIAAAGRTAGIAGPTPDEVRRWVDCGARYFVFNGESLVDWGARQALDAVRQQR